MPADPAAVRLPIRARRASRSAPDGSTWTSRQIKRGPSCRSTTPPYVVRCSYCEGDSAPLLRCTNRTGIELPPDTKVSSPRCRRGRTSQAFASTDAHAAQLVGPRRPLKASCRRCGQPACAECDSAFARYRYRRGAEFVKSPRRSRSHSDQQLDNLIELGRRRRRRRRSMRRSSTRKPGSRCSIRSRSRRRAATATVPARRKQPPPQRHRQT